MTDEMENEYLLTKKILKICDLNQSKFKTLLISFFNL